MSFGSRLRNIKDAILIRGISDPNHWLARIVGGKTASGSNVTADSALRVSAVYACVKVLAETIASLPLMLYERDGEGKKHAYKHSLYSLLHDAPNDYMTSFEWREGLVAHIALRGDSYNEKVFTGSGKIKELIPLRPIGMEVERVDGKIVYKYKHEDNKEEVFDAEKIWHTKNMPISCTYNGSTPEGLRGVSPISVARESVGLSLAADDYGGRFFSNMASVGLNAKFPAGVVLSENARTFLKESLAEYAKPENKFKSIITENGGELVKIGMSNEDNQFLESRQFQIEEIARIFRVPPIMIGHPTNTMTFASAEQLFLAFVMFTIRPWCVRLEQSMNRYLLNDRERVRYFFEFNLDGLLRGDTAGRNQAFATARQWGWMNVDEIRAKENLNPLPNGKGEIYLEPMNMTEAGKKPEPKKEEPLIKPKGDKDNA